MTTMRLQSPWRRCQAPWVEAPLEAPRRRTLRGAAQSSSLIPVVLSEQDRVIEAVWTYRWQGASGHEVGVGRALTTLPYQRPTGRVGQKATHNLLILGWQDRAGGVDQVASRSHEVGIAFEQPDLQVETVDYLIDSGWPAGFGSSAD